MPSRWGSLVYKAMAHLPVLLRETIDLLKLRSGDQVIDCTVGEGGHSHEIIQAVSPSGRLLGIDLDPENIKRVKKEFGNRTVLINDNFSNLKKIVEKYKFFPVQAILMDLGWSARQFEESGRGFSFQKDEPLDMRYNTRISRASDANNLRMLTADTAEQIVNKWSEDEIGRILREYGEERNWREIARVIVRSRKERPIKTTGDLVQIIQSSEFSAKGARLPDGQGSALGERVRNSKIHPATKTFQSLRIAVNDELNNLRQALPQAMEILAPGGRLAIISFHSLEDRIVKQFFKSQSGQTLTIITKKPIRPSREEITANPRSRSAKLRVVGKI